jgi:mono/diheme cytochrome c family protein
MMRRIAFLTLCAALAGCTRSNMDSQPKYDEYKPAGLFRNGRVLQAPPNGTVARDDLARADEAQRKPVVSKVLLARGREQYDIYCSPCHDRVGNGRGIIVERGMPQPPSFHDQRLLAADDQSFFDVISRGFGAMYGYGDRIRPRDRWAIVAYLRALQLSQHAELSDLSAEERAHLAVETKP